MENEGVVEGSLWVYGQTDLADYYSGRLTLRQVMNRLSVLPPTAPIWAVLAEQEAEPTGPAALARRLVEQRERAKRMRREQGDH